VQRFFDVWGVGRSKSMLSVINPYRRRRATGRCKPLRRWCRGGRRRDTRGAPGPTGRYWRDRAVADVADADFWRLKDPRAALAAARARPASPWLMSCMREQCWESGWHRETAVHAARLGTAGVPRRHFSAMRGPLTPSKAGRWPEIRRPDDRRTLGRSGTVDRAPPLRALGGHGAGRPPAPKPTAPATRPLLAPRCCASRDHCA